MCVLKLCRLYDVPLLLRCTELMSSLNMIIGTCFADTVSFILYIARYAHTCAHTHTHTHTHPHTHTHTQLVKLYNVNRDMLPPKKLSGNLSKQLIDKRRQLLERYLQKLIHGERLVSQSHELLEFLDVPTHVSVM